MEISELIDKLRAAYSEVGDVEVITYNNEYGTKDVPEVCLVFYKTGSGVGYTKDDIKFIHNYEPGATRAVLL